MADTILTQASLELSLNNSVKGLGSSYIKKGTYTFSVYDETSQDGDTLSETINELRDVYKSEGVFVGRLAGHDYTKGRVTSIETGPTNSNSLANVVVSIEEFISDLENSTIKLPNAEDLQSYSDVYTYEKNKEDFSYNRNFSFAYGEQTTLDDFEEFIVGIKDLIDDQRVDLSEDEIFPEDIISKRKDAVFTESIDMIQKVYSLSEIFSSKTLNEDYSFSRRQTEALGKDGFTEKQFDLEFIAHVYERNTVLQDAVRENSKKIIQEQGSKTPITISKGFSVDGRRANLSIRFSDNPKYASGDIIFYSGSLSSQGKIKNYSLSIKLKNTEGENLSARFANTKLLHTEEVTEFKNKEKIKALFGAEEGTLYEVSRSADFSRSKNEISIDVRLTDENLFYEGDKEILVFSKSASSNNVLREFSERRGEVLYSIDQRTDFLASNKLDKITTVNCSVSLTFPDALSQANKIEDFLTSEDLKLQLEELAQNSFRENKALTFLATSSSYNIDYMLNKASKNMVFNGAPELNGEGDGEGDE